MHVVLISDFDSGGGAAIAANRLLAGFAESGCNVTRIVFSSNGEAHPWVTIEMSKRNTLLSGGMIRLLPRNWKSHFQIRRNAIELNHLLQSLQPDIVNVHNIHGAQNHGWNSQIIDVSSRHAPVVWTLHDMWSFTGRCAYNFECLNYLSGCDHTCPTPNEYPSLNPSQIADAWRLKKRTFSANANIVGVSPSRWLAGIARESMWNSHPIQVIPNGVPLDVYCPLPANTARRNLGLKEDGIVALLTSATLNDRRKANQLAASLLTQRPDKDLTILTMGKGKLFPHPDDRVKELGFIEHEEKKAEVYNAASITIHPSLMDNLPNAVMESLACGTPVLAFAVGGTPELIHPQKTGWLAGVVNRDSLQSSLHQAITELRQGLDLRKSCRQSAETHYGIRSQVHAYLGLFHELAA